MLHGLAWEQAEAPSQSLDASPVVIPIPWNPARCVLLSPSINVCSTSRKTTFRRLLDHGFVRLHCPLPCLQAFVGVLLASGFGIFDFPLSRAQKADGMSQSQSSRLIYPAEIGGG